MSDDLRERVVRLEEHIKRMEEQHKRMEEQQNQLDDALSEVIPGMGRHIKSNTIGIFLASLLICVGGVTVLQWVAEKEHETTMQTLELLEVLFEAAGDHGWDLTEYRDDND